MTEFWAHSGGHLLDHHLQAVATGAGRFASALGADGTSKSWAELAGRWHDLGKYRPGFQRYVRLSQDAHIEHRVAGREKTHSAVGALWAMQQLNQPKRPYGHVLAYLIACHHAGLGDWETDLRPRLGSSESEQELAEALTAQPPEEILAVGNWMPSLQGIPGGGEGFAFWLRMLFSCLVDADFLDSEAHFDAGKPERRGGFPTLAQLHTTLSAWMAARPVQSTPVNTLRADILRQCRAKAALAPGFFSLTVPTGGGKTLSSLAFALEHARLHSQRRVIYAIPYTSIIEQTAQVFRNVFAALGDEVLIEHHSQAEADPQDETARSRLAWALGKTRRQLDTLARTHDLPLYTLAPATAG